MNVKKVKKPINSVIVDRIIMSIFFSKILTYFRIITFDQMNNYFVILAAGKSKRFHKKLDKQFYIYKNKEIIDHSIDKSLSSKLFKKILVVTNNLKHFKKRNIQKRYVSLKEAKKDRTHL